MIYLVRHGEAAASWGEHPNPGLSADGQTQAASVANTLLSKSIKHAMTSPMARCQETAGAFADLSGLPLDIEPRVTEIPTPTDIEDRQSWLRALMTGTWDETPDLVRAWHRDLINTVHDLRPNTVVFSHFIAINAVVGALTGSDHVTVFRPNYCSITVLERTNDSLKLVERGQSLDTRVL